MVFGYFYTMKTCAVLFISWLPMKFQHIFSLCVLVYVQRLLLYLDFRQLTFVLSYGSHHPALSTRI